MSGKPRIVIVSPFLDKSHGTERIIIEWFSRLGDDVELHIYSQRVEDFDRSKFTFHRIVELPGPHLVNYLWWFIANQIRRGWDSTFGGLKPDLVFTPGINCMDADVISVHVVFAQLCHEAQPELKVFANPLRLWPRLLHRRLYYSLIVFLERRIYSNRRIQLIPMAKKTQADLNRFYPGERGCQILYLGLEHERFNKSRNAELRRASRERLGLTERDFVVLLIGNDLLNKGVPVLVEAICRLAGLPLRLLVVSRESGNAYRTVLKEKGLTDRVRFFSPRQDVEFYFAAADLYTGPSLEDAFAMPAQEAMACGLPVIVSATAGVSEIITDGENGLILEDPRDANALAAMIRRVYEDEPFRIALGQNAAKSVEQFTWERNAQDLRAILDDVLRRKRDSAIMRKALEPDR